MQDPRERDNDFFSTEFLVTYESFTQPPIDFAYNLDTLERRVVQQSEVSKHNTASKNQVEGFEKANYVVQRVHARNNEVEVPITLFYKQSEVNIDPVTGGPATPCPLLLFGYGSYGALLMPWWDSTRLSLVDRGWWESIIRN